MKTYSLIWLFLFLLQQAFSQALTLDPPGPNIDVCGFPSATVTANPSGALSYEWYRNDCGQIWLATTGQTVNLSTGYWYCVATWPGGYTSTSPTVKVRIPSSVSCQILHCNVPACASTGCNLELSGPLCPNAWSSYQWTLNNNPIAGATNWSYNATASGSYHCIFSNSLCSVTSLDSATIQFACDVPTNRTTTNIASTKATLNWSTNSCAVGYRVRYKKSGTSTWTGKNVNTNIGYKKITGLLANTSYVWQVRSKCNNNPSVNSAWTSSLSFSTPLKMAEEETTEATLNIFPNPASNIISIAFDDATDIRMITIQNLVGQILIEKQFSKDGNDDVEMDVSALQAGEYLLTIFTREGKMVKMFVKE